MAVHSDNFDEIKARFDKIKPCALQYFALDENKLKWKSDLERLKNFRTETIGIKGKWTAPGGNSKRFKSQSGQFQSVSLSSSVAGGIAHVLTGKVGQT